MPVDSRHPDYVARAEEWATMRDCARGATAVKARGVDHLPMPDGFAAQEDKGVAMYAAYLARAQFPDILAPTVGAMVGMIHRREAEITMPLSMEGLWERATREGLPLEAFHQRITSEILETGRYGVLADAPAEGADLPYLAGYTAEAVINWSEDRTLFVLDESGRERVDEFEWKDVKRYRVLRMAESVYTQQAYAGTEAGEAITPGRRGGGALDTIPFVVIGARDTLVDPDDPPLLGVARNALAIYRLDADMRHQLFMSGQETFVVIGADNPPAAIGSSVVITLPLGADAKYVGPAAKGIEAHRVAIQDERQAAVASGARVADAQKGGVESGEALRIRNVSRTATMVTVALASAQGLEKALRHIAVMIGAKPDEVIVKPNLEFVQELLEPKAAAELVKMWQGGAISFETLYENLQRGGIASAERDAADEREMIEGAEPQVEPVAA